MYTRIDLGLIGILFLAFFIGSCGPSTNTPDMPGGSGQTVPGIGGQNVALSLGDAGQLTLSAGKTVRKTTRVKLFEAASDKPLTCLVVLPSSAVHIDAAAGDKALITKQAMPANGAVQLHFTIAPGGSGNACDAGVPLAQFDITSASGAADVTHPASEASTAAMNTLLSGDVDVCVEATSNFNASLSITDPQLAFGDSKQSAPKQTPEEEQAELDAFFDAPSVAPPSWLNGCWNLRMTPDSSTSYAANAMDPFVQIYDFSYGGTLERVWDQQGSQTVESIRLPPLSNDPAVIRHFAWDGYDSSAMQLTAIEANVLLDREQQRLSFGWQSLREGDGRDTEVENCYARIRRATRVVFEDCEVFDDPVEAFMGRFTMKVITETAYEDGEPFAVEDTITGTMVAMRTDCPNAADPQVVSQEEQAAMLDEDEPDEEPVDSCMVNDRVAITVGTDPTGNTGGDCDHPINFKYQGSEKLWLLTHVRSVLADGYVDEYWYRTCLGPGCDGATVVGTTHKCSSHETSSGTVTRDTIEYMVIRRLPECDWIKQDPGSSGMPTVPVNCPCR